MITIIALYIILGIIAFIVILLHFSVRVKLSAQSGGKPDIQVKWLFLTVYPRKPKEKKEKKNKKKKSSEEAASKADYTEEEIEELIRQADEAELSEQLQQEQAKAIEPPPEVETAEAEKAQDEKAQTEMIQTEDTESSETVGRKLSRKEKKELKKKEKAEKAQVDADGEEKPKGGLAKIKGYIDMVMPYVPLAWRTVKKLLKTIRFTKLDIRLASGKEDAYEAAMAYGKLNAAVFNGVATVGRIFTVEAKNVQVDCRFNEKVFEYDVSTTVMVRPSALIAIVFCTGVNFLRIFIPQWLRKRKERRRIKKEKAKAKKYNETELLTNE